MAGTIGEAAEVFGSLANVIANDLKGVKRLSRQTVGLQDTGVFNIGV